MATAIGGDYCCQGHPTDRAYMKTAFASCYELRYTSLFNEGRALSFPCDGQGHVDLDRLSERARENYLYARAVVGKEFSMPAVMVCDTH